MSKQSIHSAIISQFTSLGIPFQTGTSTDITVTQEFLDAGWSTGNKKITYEALIFLDEAAQTAFMWEKTTEIGQGFSFGSDSESSFQSGATLYRKVKSIQYGPDGKAFEYTLNLGAIPKAVKDASKANGWRFKTVLKKEKALYPAGYVPTSTIQPIGQTTTYTTSSSSNTAPIPQHVPTSPTKYFCEGCGMPHESGAKFCMKCGTPVKNTSVNNTVEQVPQVLQQQQYSAPHMAVNTPAKIQDKKVMHRKVITVSLIILMAITIIMFWLLGISWLGWVEAIGVLIVLYFLSGKLSSKGCLPLILVWIVALIILFSIFIFSDNTVSPSANENTPSSSVNTTKNSTSRAKTPFYINRYEVNVGAYPQRVNILEGSAYCPYVYCELDLSFLKDEEILDARVVNAHVIKGPKIGKYFFCEDPQYIKHIENTNSFECDSAHEFKNGELQFDVNSIADDSLEAAFILYDIKSIEWDNSWTEADYTGEALLNHAGITSDDLRTTFALDVQITGASGIYYYPFEIEMLPGDFLKDLMSHPDTLDGYSREFTYNDNERNFIKK